MPRLIGLRLIVAIVSAACALTTAPAHAAARVVVLRGEISQDTVLKRKHTYVLQGLVTVRAGSSLVVRPGVTVLADQGSTLVVERGARLVAVGTEERPIVFTSAQPEAERRRGDWSGIVVNGFAPVSAPGGVATGPGDTGSYGGYEPDDDSGSLSFVRIEYTGYPNGPETRAPGLALRGVGAKTSIASVEILNGDGDGLEIAGGSVFVRTVASIGCARAAFRFGTGWTGGAQFLLAQQRRDLVGSSDMGIEAEQSTPKVSNVTVVGTSTGVRFGIGARGTYADLVVVGCAGAGLEVRTASTAADVARGDLELRSVLASANLGGDVAPELRDALATRNVVVDRRDPLLRNAYDEATPDFRPVETSPVFDRSSSDPLGAAFAPVGYAGAFGAETSWTGTWANFETPPEPRRLANAATSPEALARAFLDSLAASDVVGLKRLRITKKEFCWYVWPELPASRLPNVSCDFAWSQATLNSLAGLAEVLREQAGHRYELVSVRFAGAVERYDGFTVHGDTRVTVRDESGDVREMKLFGSMLELDGRFKLFSFVVD